jgi:8-oxo-dGTP pyrophosphatase MutT (NUDIX family)
MPGPAAPWAYLPISQRVITQDALVSYIDMQQRLLHQLEELDIDDSQATEIPEAALEELGDNDLVTKPAAVLVPFVVNSSGVIDSVIVMTRTMDVSHHKGQVSFPGGMVEPGDKNVVHTALRETHEEIGVSPEKFRILGTLTDVTTRSRSGLITPVVALCDEASLDAIAINDAEVETLHRISLEPLLAPDHYANEIWDFGSMSATIHMFFARDTDQRDVFIWGATAHILTDALHCLKAH